MAEFIITFKEFAQKLNMRDDNQKTIDLFKEIDKSNDGVITRLEADAYNGTEDIISIKDALTEPNDTSIFDVYKLQDEIDNEKTTLLMEIYNLRVAEEAEKDLIYGFEEKDKKEMKNFRDVFTEDLNTVLDGIAIKKDSFQDHASIVNYLNTELLKEENLSMTTEVKSKNVRALMLGAINIIVINSLSK